MVDLLLQYAFSGSREQKPTDLSCYTSRHLNPLKLTSFTQFIFPEVSKVFSSLSVFTIFILWYLASLSKCKDCKQGCILHQLRLFEWYCAVRTQYDGRRCHRLRISSEKLK